MTDINVGAFSEALNDKLDRDASNAASDGKQTIVGWAIPDYANVVSIASSDFPYTAAKKGFVIVEGSASSSTFSVSVDDVEIVSLQGAGTYNVRSGWVIVDVGDIVKVTSSSSVIGRFIPMKGA